MKTARTVLLPLFGWIMPNWMATFPVSAIIGKGIFTSMCSSIHSTHFIWE